MSRHHPHGGVRHLPGPRFNTNATLLTRERAEGLVAAQLHRLFASLDGATAATYEHIREGADFARVQRNVLRLLAIRRSRGARLPRVTLVFVAMRHNVAELPALVRLAADWGVDDVSVQNLSHSFEDTGDAPGYREIRAFTADQALWGSEDATARRSFARARRLADRLGIPLALPGLDEPSDAPPAEERLPCDWPWQSGYILRDGRVQPCCMIMGSDRQDAVLGDAGRDGFAAAWHSPAFQNFRRVLASPEPPAVCRGCALYRGVF